MRTSLARRSLIAITTIAMVAVGAGIAGADSRSSSRSSSAGSGNEWGIDFQTLDRDDALADVNVSGDVDLGAWNAFMSRRDGTNDTRKDNSRNDSQGGKDNRNADEHQSSRRTLRVRVAP